MKQILIAILFIFTSLVVQAKEFELKEVTYPPYPDIWGYDFSDYPAVIDNDAFGNGKVAYNGDYWFLVLNKIKYYKNNKRNIIIEDKRNLVKFFEGTIEQLDYKKNRDSIISNRIANTRSLIHLDKITFLNGDTLEFVDTTPSAKYCFIDHVRGSHFIKRNNNGDVIGKYSILIAKPNVEIIEDWNESYTECSVPSDDDHIHQQLKPLVPYMIKLKDDTFLLYDNLNMIVRFDQNLKTKFKPVVNFKTRDGRTLKTNLFVIQYDIVDKMAQDLFANDKPVSQGLQDGIMDYVLKYHND